MLLRVLLIKEAIECSSANSDVIVMIIVHILTQCYSYRLKYR